MADDDIHEGTIGGTLVAFEKATQIDGGHDLPAQVDQALDRAWSTRDTRHLLGAQHLLHRVDDRIG